MLGANVKLSVKYLGSTEDRNPIHAWEVREGFPKLVVLPDKNSRRCHPLNPFKQISQRRQDKSIVGRKGETGVLEGRGRKLFQEDKKAGVKTHRQEKAVSAVQRIVRSPKRPEHR